MALIEFAIDIGSSNTVIYKKGSGIVLREPTLIALQNTQKHNYKVLAVGLEAKKLQGKTGEDVTIVSPIVEGVIKNTELAVEMVKYFLSKIAKGFDKLKALVIVPCGVTDEEIKDFQKVMFSSGVGKVSFVSSLVCLSLGSNNLQTNHSQLVVNIGGGKTEVGAVINSSVLSGCNISFGGRAIDNSIVDFIQNSHNLKISNVTAEKIKNEIASLYETDRSNMEIAGADIMSNRFVSDVVSAREIRPVIADGLSKIIATILAVIGECAPDVVADIHNKGILLSGGVSQLVGIENFMSKILETPVTVLEQPENTVIMGAGKLLNDAVLYAEVVSE
ncbi:MAG: rod shape-determining protein [Clostridia bacterium]|nr:rod shape-determining protein [Clostridia bacterium]